MFKLNIQHFHIAIISSLVPFLDRFKEFKSIIKRASDWDFFMTTAGVGLYLITSEASPQDDKEAREKLAEINKEMPKALDDFNSFQKPKELLLPSIGLWVLWNLKGAEPTQKETQELAGRIGHYLSKVVSELTPD